MKFIKAGDAPDDVPVTLGCVKLGSEPTDVTHGVRTTSSALDGREAHEHGCGSRRVSEYWSESVFGRSVVKNVETPMSSSAASVDDAFGNTLVVESVDLLHRDLVLKKSGTGALGVCSLQPGIRRKTQLRRVVGGHTMFRCYRRAYRA